MKYLHIAIVCVWVVLIGYWAYRRYMSTDLRPKVQRRENKSDPDLAKLRLACGGNNAVVDRLMDYEKRREPSITLDEAAQRALERLARDRGSLIQ